MNGLEGKVALVTGCGRYKGIGRGIATALAAQGAKLAISDISPGGARNRVESDDPDSSENWRGLESLAEELELLGPSPLRIVGDVGVKDDVERMVAEVIAHFGRIDILVNNAGAPHGNDRGWTWEIPEEAFDLVMRTNAKGVFLMSSAVARHMLSREGSGRIINISSNAGKRGLPKRAPYSASKFAIIGLTQVLAQELAPNDITVNAICPGAIDTPRQSSNRAQAASGQETTTAWQTTPVGRLGQPDDIAAIVVYLASPAASFVTGQSIGVNGGNLMF